MVPVSGSAGSRRWKSAWRPRERLASTTHTTTGTRPRERTRRAPDRQGQQGPWNGGAGSRTSRPRIPSTVWAPRRSRRGRSPTCFFGPVVVRRTLFRHACDSGIGLHGGGHPCHGAAVAVIRSPTALHSRSQPSACSVCPGDDGVWPPEHADAASIPAPWGQRKDHSPACRGTRPHRTALSRHDPQQQEKRAGLRPTDRGLLAERRAVVPVVHRAAPVTPLTVVHAHRRRFACRQHLSRIRDVMLTVATLTVTAALVFSLMP